MFQFSGKNISKSFQEKIVLRDCEFSFVSGQRIIITGKNGVGKTTFLKIISGHFLCSHSELIIENQNFNSLTFTELKSKIIFIASQDEVIYPRLTGLDNIKYFAEILNISSQKLENRILKWSEIPIFREAIESSFHHCSQGMKRVLSLFIMTLVEPLVIIFDECFKSFDIETRKRLLLLLNEEFKDSILIFSTHHPQSFRETFDIVEYSLEGGKLVN
ncbi:ATP-binding cassette domain-containing protein [Halobacteriovorax sp. HLS]|uniref:ATP-binding cassette domain-containing protein n=1 Tax=Halobacteriovorax sp. HLS TaxID=2234000 RepID=UPI000FDCD9EE|nr:ATP-binding cassette domain-containing protein [Halobacteriovorax sp. HLS]